MDPEEMAAEKLRCLGQRRKPRDLLDLRFLLGKGVRPDEELLTLKLEEVGLEPTLTPVELVEGYDITEGEWNSDLGILIEGVPDLSAVRRDVLAYLGDR